MLYNAVDMQERNYAKEAQFGKFTVCGPLALHYRLSSCRNMESHIC